MTALERLDDRRLALIERQAAILARSGLVPVDNPDAAAYAMLRAIGVGVDPLQTFEHFHVFETRKGQWRLTVSAQLLGALFIAAGGHITWLASDDQHATARAERRGQPTTTLTYTIADARKAGLLSKDNWKNHPAPMLRAACQRQLVRMAAPDVLLGLPPSEVDLDADFDETEDLDGSYGNTAVENGPAGNPPTIPSSDPAGPTIDDHDRAELARRYTALTDIGREHVRAQARTHRVRWPLPDDATPLEALTYHRMIGHAEAAIDQQMARAWEQGFEHQTARHNPSPRSARDAPDVAGQGGGTREDAGGGVGEVPPADEPIPTEVHDNQPEAADGELGVPKYDPEDGEPF